MYLHFRHNLSKLSSTTLPLLLLYVLLGTTNAFAETSENSSQPAAEPQQQEESGLDAFGKKTASTLYHEPLSRSIENISQKLDTYFGNEQLYKDYTASYGRFRLTTKYKRGGEFTMVPKFQLRLKLPNLNKHLKLKLELDAEENEDSPEQTVETFDLLSGDLPPKVSSSNFSTSISPGINYNTDEDELDPYAKIKFQYRFPLLNWSSSLSQTFERYRSTGNGTRTNLTLMRPIGERYTLTLTSKVYHNEGEYTHTDYQITQGIKLAYQATRRLTISSEAIIQGKTDPNWQHDLYTVNIQFRKNIHEEYVFLELKPEIEFDSEKNFHGAPSLSLRLEVHYGAIYYNKK